VESQATWKKFNSATNWQSAGAQGALDRGSTVLGTVSATATGIRTITLNAAGLAVVQGWINNPATNFGFILQDYANSADDDLLFSSREATVAANRPQLQLVYNPPSVAPLSLRTVAATASATGGDDIFTSKLIQTSTDRNDFAGAKLVQRDSPAANASHSQSASLLLVAAPSRRLSSKATDIVLADLGEEECAPAGWNDLLFDLASAHALSAAL